MKRIAYYLSLSLVCLTDVHATDWSYQKENIRHWHTLEGAALCASGTTQSPIDINTKKIKSVNNKQNY